MRRRWPRARWSGPKIASISGRSSAASRCSVPRIAHVRTSPGADVPRGTSARSSRPARGRRAARRGGPGPGCRRRPDRVDRGRRSRGPRAAGRGGGGGGSRRPSGRPLRLACGLSAASRLRARRQPARDDLGDAVAGHRDAVQAVGRLHRALLVRDDDELRAVGEAAQEREEAVDVEVVERGLDLVEDVERARPGEEDGEQERERGQRLLAAGQQRQALGRLAGGRDLDLDAGVGPPRPAPRPRRRARRPRPRASSSFSPPPSTGRGPVSSRTSRSRPRPPGKSCSATSSKLLARRPRRSPRTPRGCGGRCRGSGPRARASRSRGPRAGVSSSSTCATASSYSRLASGLTGPSCSRRRRRRSIRASRSARVASRRAAPRRARPRGRAWSASRPQLAVARRRRGRAPAGRAPRRA